MNFRNKVLITVFIITFLCSYFIYFFYLDNFVLYGFILFSMLIFYFINYWLFKFNIHPRGFLTILPLPSLFFVAFLLFFNFFIKNLPYLWVIIYISLFILLEYYLIMNQNILNLWMFEHVGLYRAALNINLFYSVFTYFILNIAIFFTPFEFLIKILISLFVFLLLFIIFANLSILNLNLILLIIINSIFLYLLTISLFLLGFLKIENGILIAIAFSILFKTILTNALYSNYAFHSFTDYVLIMIESFLFGILLYISSF